MQDRDGADFSGREASNAGALRVEEFAAADDPSAPFWRERAEVRAGHEFSQGDELRPCAIFEPA
jgi:hypothetical protein